jgi:CRISPR-associated protein Csc3
MTTLLQTLLIETLPLDTDPILQRYIETVVPAMEREFGLVSALGGSEAVHRDRLTRQNDRYADEKAKRWAASSDQSLLVHVLNGLLVAWSLIPFLSVDEVLSDEEKCLLCLGLTLHDYNKYCQGEEEDSPKAHEVDDILQLCEDKGELLNFTAFWVDWRNYISEIGFLAQNTQYKCGGNPVPSNWPTFKIRSRRLSSPLRPLLAFGDISVHMKDPAEVMTTTRGDRLREHLRTLGIDRQILYHRLRNTTGLLSNAIHNAALHFNEELDWQPILFFAQGVVYLAPVDAAIPDRDTLKYALWDGIGQLLRDKMLGGDIGFKRDGKGVKVSPQTRELFTPAELIRGLPMVIAANVKNEKITATPKRLDSLELDEQERSELENGADLRSDRVAELISLLQREFFSAVPEFTPWILQWLKIDNAISIEQTQIQKGGVNYGWYHASAKYIVCNSTINLEQLTAQLQILVTDLADWAEEKQLLPKTNNPTCEAFLNYVEQYLEVAGWDTLSSTFQHELEQYTIAKTKAAKQPICSLSSGEFLSEDQMDSVVLFKPQQYSNKNVLGGRQIKRGISKIWSLEMLLRQVIWAAPSGKLEDQQPIFLYIFPAFVYSPQMAKAVRVLVNNLKRVNFWEVHKFWLQNEMDVQSLRNLNWISDPPESGRFSDVNYGKGKIDIPFMAISYTTTRGKTLTDAWVEPALLSLLLPMLLGVKVVATASQIPLYNSDSEFRESVKLDGVANFWSVLGLPAAMHLEEFHQGRIQKLDELLQRLLIAYSVHLDAKGAKPDPRWQALSNTVREMMTDVLNIFALADSWLRAAKRTPSTSEVLHYWHYANFWSQGDIYMTEKLSLIQRIVTEYRQFYQVRSSESSHTILLPLSKALEIILSVPDNLSDEDLILEGAGQLNDALDRRKIYERPIRMDKSIDIVVRKAKELEAVHTFMSTCVNDLFKELYKGDRALLQENRNRIKSGAEFAYRLIDSKKDSNTQESENSNSET